MSETYYKVLNHNGSCYHGGKGRWRLPKSGKPGEWMPPIIGELKPCSNGYHILKRGQLIEWIAPPVAVFEVEVNGKVVWNRNKGVARKARLVRKIETWTEQAARLFACDCADHYRHELPETELEEFDRCILTIRGYAFGLVDRYEMEMAGTVVWEKAGAWAMPWTRAWAKLGVGAGAVAWAWAESWEWETNRLFAYLEGEVNLNEAASQIARKLGKR